MIIWEQRKAYETCVKIMYYYISKSNHPTHNSVVHTGSSQLAFRNPHTTSKIARNIDSWQRKMIIQITKGKGGEV